MDHCTAHVRFWGVERTCLFALKCLQADIYWPFQHPDLSRYDAAPDPESDYEAARRRANSQDPAASGDQTQSSRCAEQDYQYR
jgi:hypothetical protein